MAHKPADFDDLPDPLKADLADLFPADVNPSPAADQALLSRARAHFAGVQRRRRRMRVLEYAIATAIVAVVAAVILPTFRTHPDGGRGAALARMEARGDVNHDGVVDIRDAMLLARRIDAKHAREVNDYNNDKTIDRLDVDAIAMRAVRLDPGVTR